MKLRKSMIVTLYVMIILAPISKVYAADTHGTYTDTLTEDANPVDVYIEEEYIGLYSDYRMYQVNLDKDQNIKLRLEVPEGADFDLFVYTEDETQGRGSMSDTPGEDEELSLTAPETGVYKFVVAAWSGSGEFTLHWETLGAGFFPTYVWIVVGGVGAAVAVIIVLGILLRRRARAPMPPPPAPVYAPTPVPTPAAPDALERWCPRCGGPLTWIEQYQRWYCYNCREYV